MPAPIILFTYNRPQHALEAIQSLSKNELASESELFIYSDGAKSHEDEVGVNETRKVIKAKFRNCNEVNIW